MRITTSGDSHGKGLFGIVEGFPAHFKIELSKINDALKLRKSVYGRGARMKIESDRVEILSGIWNGETSGAPLTFFIKNASTTPPNRQTSTPRPGHADFAGMLKYNFDDTRVVTERSSARRTAMDVAIGEFFRQALEKMKIRVWAYTVGIGKIETNEKTWKIPQIGEHPLLCPDQKAERLMIAEIDKAAKNGNSLGGKVRVLASGLPIGLGTFNTYHGRFTSRIAQAFFDIPSVRGVLFGDILDTYRFDGYETIDEIHEMGVRKTNHVGGIEGGMSNGQPISVDLLVKPVPTQKRGTITIDMNDGSEAVTNYVRSDTCVVAAIAIVSRAVLSTVIFSEIMNEFGGSVFGELCERVELYRKRVRIDG